jgi:acyl carrier protein
VTGVDVREDRDATLAEVGLDSLAAYEMLIAFDEMFSEQVPIDLWDTLVTVGDMYAYYETVAVRQ